MVEHLQYESSVNNLVDIVCDPSNSLMGQAVRVAFYRWTDWQVLSPIRRVFVGSIGSDYNPIRNVIFSCLTKTDIAIGLAMFCKQRSFRTPRTVHHTKSCLKLSFYRSIRIYRVDFEKI